MNRLKFSKPKAGVVGLWPASTHVQQNPSPQERTLRAPWNSPARVKARLLRLGYVLTGKRQSRRA